MGAQTSGAATSSLGCGLDTTIRTNTKAEAASPVQPINQKINPRIYEINQLVLMPDLISAQP